MTVLAPRSDFPLLARHPEVRYLDSAATAQKPAAMLEAERAFYENDYANPHRGAYALSARATDSSFSTTLSCMAVDPGSTIAGRSKV